MKKIIGLVQALFICYPMFAQPIEDEAGGGLTKLPEILLRVQPNQDNRLDSMLAWHIENNLRKGGMDGYRVEIFFSSAPDAKEKALEIKREFLTSYPDLAVHLKFRAPDFRVRVGDFRTKNEALKLKKEIEYKYQSYIVPDLIKFPELVSSEKGKINE